MEPLLIVQSHENHDWKNKDPKSFTSLMIGYSECMPDVHENLLEQRFYMNTHFSNNDFKDNPKFFVAFDDSKIEKTGIVAISALYVFPKYRNKNYGKVLIEQLKYLAQENIILQVAVNIKKEEYLRGFYKKMGFETTGVAGKADILGISYIDYFWKISPIKLSVTDAGTKIEPILD